MMSILPMYNMGLFFVQIFSVSYGHNVMPMAFCLYIDWCKQKAFDRPSVFFLKGRGKMSLLEIDGLTHAFGDNEIFKNASMTINST